MNDIDRAELQRRFGHLWVWGVTYCEEAVRGVEGPYYRGGMTYSQAVAAGRGKLWPSITLNFGPPPAPVKLYLVGYLDAGDSDGEPSYADSAFGVFDSKPDLAQALGVTPPEPEATDKVAVIVEGYDDSAGRTTTVAVYRWYAKRGWVKLAQPVPF